MCKPSDFGGKIHYITMMANPIKQPRKEYTRATLSKSSVLRDPLAQFRIWFEEISRTSNPEPNAMALATAGSGGASSLRMVLLKEFDRRGFVFYGNYLSRKGRELAENPRAALLFYWAELQRQVRVEGTVKKLTPKESLAYFQTRPFESQLSAWASRQSREIENREVLEKRFAELLQQYRGKSVPLPPDWGGYRLIPERLEFWQGRENRLHDRILYTRLKHEWRIVRLSP